jgi:hypothetical protein
VGGPLGLETRCESGNTSTSLSIVWKGRQSGGWTGVWTCGNLSQNGEALSHNEIEILDRQIATLSYQLSEIAGLLESRLGETNELATSARRAQREFANFAERSRRRVALSETGRPESNSQTA